ncbi:MAG: IclR family transcriptional regulator [Alicyclobacillus sp.]|nr:IclR family transcriptional regulator [Alicyclobacillus sp.]
MPDYTISVVRDALKILSMFDYFNTSYSLTEISQATGLPKPKTVRLLYTLEQSGFVSRSQETGQYSLGPAARRIGRVTHIHHRARHVVQDAMWKLRNRWSETVNFGIIQNNRIVYAAIIDSPHPFRVVEQVGDTVPVSTSAMGRAILAVHPNPSVLCSPDVLADLEPVISEVRATGYAVDNEEVELGVRCVGVAVLDSDNTILGGLSISGPATRLTLELVDCIGQDLVTVSNEITESLKTFETSKT